MVCNWVSSSMPFARRCCSQWKNQIIKFTLNYSIKTDLLSERNCIISHHENIQKKIEKRQLKNQNTDNRKLYDEIKSQFFSYHFSLKAVQRNNISWTHPSKLRPHVSCSSQKHCHFLLRAEIICLFLVNKKFCMQSSNIKTENSPGKVYGWRLRNTCPTVITAWKNDRS